MNYSKFSIDKYIKSGIKVFDTSYVGGTIVQSTPVEDWIGKDGDLHLGVKWDDGEERTYELREEGSVYDAATRLCVGERINAENCTVEQTRRLFNPKGKVTYVRNSFPGDGNLLGCESQRRISKDTLF